MLQVHAHQRSMPHVVIESLALIAHLPSNLAHGRHHHDGPTSEDLGVSVLHAGGLTGQRLTLSALLQLPLRVMVRFLLLISIVPIGKLCALALLKKASLVLLTT
jgi:hypothetical protein